MTGAERELLPVAGGRETWLTLRGLLGPHRGHLALAAGVLLVATSAGLAVPAILGHIVDLVQEGRGSGAIEGPVLLLLAVTTVAAGLTAVGYAMVARVGELVLARLRERVVGRALALPPDRVERTGTGDLVARVGEDVSGVAEATRSALPLMVVSGLTIGLTVVGLALLDWRLAVAGLFAVPVQAWTLRWYLAHAGGIYAAERRVTGARSQQLLAAFTGAPTLRAFRLGPEHERRVAQRSQEAMDWTLRTIVLRSRFFARLNAAELVGLSCILACGSWLVDRGSASVGDATAAGLYFIRLFGPINTLLIFVDDLQRAAASLARLVGVATLPGPEADDGTRSAGALRLRGVSHAYVAGHEVLHGVDLELAPGEHVALVGVSGAAKTTLAQIAAGVLVPSAGEVDNGGRRSVGLVTQEVHVFAGTLAEDLRLADSGASDAALRGALQRVGGLEWAEGLPDGLATVVGDGGHRLTAAQAQQLALARLLLADPPVAILDEATAEAGSAGARVLERAAEAALEGRTALVVAHRLTQAAAADRVAVMEDGRIVEQGPHAELAGADGPYGRLWAAWSGARR